MKKGILIISMIWGLFAVGMAQEKVEETIGTFDRIEIETIVDIDTLDTIEVLPLITEEMAHAVVHQDSLVTQLMRDKRIGYVRGEQLIDGFRVQIYASNASKR